LAVIAGAVGKMNTQSGQFLAGPFKWNQNHLEKKTF